MRLLPSISDPKFHLHPKRDLKFAFCALHCPLHRVLWEYGEEPKARGIARRLVAARPVTTTAELVDVVGASIGAGPPKLKRKALTRVFQVRFMRFLNHDN